MFLMGVVTVLLLLSIQAENYNNNELSKLIERIHLESHSATVCFVGIEGDFLGDFMSQHSYIPIVYFSSLQNDYKWISPINVVLVFNDSVSENHWTFENWQLLVNQLRDRRFVVISTNSLHNLNDYFDFFGRNKFTRIFGVVDRKSYVFFPYASSKIRRVNKDGRLPNALEDLTNFTFRTTIQKDFPRAFRYTDSKGQSRIGGRIGLMFINFLRRHNATFEEIIINNSTSLYIPGVINATLRNDIDISMNVYGESKGLDMSYPLKFESWNIMVPINGHLDPYEYFKRPFAPSVWLCIAMTLIYITAIEVILNRYTGLRPSIWPSFSQTFLMVLGRPLERPLTSNYFRMHCQVFLFSFIIGNLYSIYFTSFLTVFIEVKQYDTMQDLMDNNVAVMIPDFEFELLSDFTQFPRGFEKVFLPTDHSVFLTQMNSMRNTNFAYTIGGDKCEFLIRLQSISVKPLFRKAQVTLSQFYLGFLLPQHSPFKEILDEFIFEIEQTGLILKWEADAAYQCIQAGHRVNVSHIKKEHTDGKHSALTLRHLQFGFSCLTLGLMLGLVVFICELSIGRFCV